MEQFVDEKEDTVIIGDFNFPEIDWIRNVSTKDEDHPASLFLESTQDGMLNQHIKEPTRWREGQKANTLDLLFTSKDGLVSDIEVLPPIGKSDHGVVLFNIHRSFGKDTTTRKKFLYEKGNYAEINKRLDIDWNSLLEDKSTEESWQLLKSKVSEACQEYIPTITISGERREQPPWMTKECLLKVKEKKNAWRRYIAVKQRRSYQLYARAWNQVKWICKKAVKQYEKELSKSIKRNPKAFWNYVNYVKHREIIPELTPSVLKLVRRKLRYLVISSKQFSPRRTSKIYPTTQASRYTKS